VLTNLNHYRDNFKLDAYTYTDPISARREFKPNFYDLMLTDMDIN